MASNPTIFFAGVGTTFIILGAGFGSGLFMANSALKEPVGVHARGQEQVRAPIRVILPSSAQAAEPKPAVQQAEQPAPTPQVQPPSREQQGSVEKAEKPDNKKVYADKRRKRIAERKARRLAARLNHRSQETAVVAYGGDEAHPTANSFNYIGN